MVRQYIGARYVIKVYQNSQDPSSAEWEASTSYEPITLVTYNNSSYLSKKEVPSNIGDPASNPQYWVITGAYNGQIAALQTQLNKIKDFVTPEQFGAAGDGTSDDTQAIQDAIDNADGRIVLLSQAYRVTDIINLVTGTRIEGVNGATIIDDVPSLTPYYGILDGRNINNVSINNVTFIGENTSGSAVYTVLNADCIIMFRDCQHIEVTNCSFKGITKGNCVIAAGSKFVTVDTCDIEYYTYCGIGFYDTTKWSSVRNCKIVNSRYNGEPMNQYGIVLAGYTSTTYTAGDHIWCENNYLSNDVPKWEGIDAHGGGYLFINNNHIFGFPTGIALIRNSGTPSYICGYVNIDNNQIYGAIDENGTLRNGSAGIIASGEEISITNNTLRKCGHVFLPTTDTELCAGIVIDGTIQGLIIANNSLNACAGCGISFVVNGVVNRTIISNNYIRVDTQVNGAQYLINFHNDSSIADVIIEGNTFANYAGCRMPLTLGTNMYIKFNNNNWLYYLANADVNIENCKPDRCKDSDISSIAVGKLGDFIRCVNNANIAGWICTSESPVTYKPIAL